MISNTDILKAMYPTYRQEVECIFLLGTNMESADREVVSDQKELLQSTVVGVLKVKMENLQNRAVPLVQVFL